MTKVFSITQIREADRYTIDHEPILSVDLMERAAKSCFEWLRLNVSLQEFNCVTIVCGMGNNGGDGLALARMLHQANVPVDVYVLGFAKAGSVDFEINRQRLEEIGVQIKAIFNAMDFCINPQSDLIIDAIFGSGLNREIDEETKQVISKINDADALRISIDIPSGLFVEKTSVGGSVVKADHTLTFQFPKLPFFFPENAPYVGEFHVLDIGLHKEYVQQTPTITYYVDSVDYPQCIVSRPKFSHKGTFGHALLIAGSYGKVGAAMFAAKACMYSGVGLLTVHLPCNAIVCMQTAFPEAMISIDGHDNIFTSLPSNMDRYTAAGIGPGLGTAIETAAVLESFLRVWDKPLLLDADALNIIALYSDKMLPLLRPNTIITPHVKEFERLVGCWKNDFERLEIQKNFAKQNGIIVVLKGANTSICCPDGDVYFNSTGNPGMATGGSGDVLSGIITSLLAQGVSAKEAAVLGVYLHGMAGDVAAAEVGQVAMTASDICNGIRIFMKSIQR